MKKLAIVTTHPIQYNAPWFKLLRTRGVVRLKVFYTWGEAARLTKYDPGFNKNIEWNIPLLEGYDYTFVKNVAALPGSHHYPGIDNPTLIEEIEDWHPTAILVVGWKFKSHLKVLRHFAGKKKILFRGDSNLLDEAPGFTVKKILRRLFLRWVYRHVDIALYVGTANKKYYQAVGLKNDQLIFAPHATDNKRFAENVNLAAREEAGLPKDAFVFIFAGKFETKKDPELLLDTFLQINDPAAHLLMVGNGELEGQLHQTAGRQATGVQASIHFLPFQNQQKMPGIYSMADVLVLPSKGPGETWGLCVNEAMACSKAVLVSDKCGCVADLVKEGINGYVFKNRDSNSLLKQMNKLLLGKQQIKAMGRQSLQIIQEWNFEKICLAVERCVK